MHIAIDARIVNSSTGRYVERLLHYLEQIDTSNRYTVLVPEKDRDYWKPTNPNFTVQTVNYDNYSVAEQTGYLRFLNRLAPDLVHFCMPQQPVLYKGKHVTTFHDLSLLRVYNSDKNWLMFRSKQLIGKFVFKRVARTSRRILVPTRFVGEDVARTLDVPPEKITLTYEAAEIQAGGNQLYRYPFKQFIMYVGAQSDYKNIKRVGDAHQLLLKKYPDLGLILVGSKNASALINEAYFKKKGYRNILFTGYLPDQQLSYLYHHAGAYVFASLTEGFGLPGLEAMGHGVPVVSSNATCLPEVYGDAAHYFDPTDVPGIAAAIDTVLSDEKLRTSLVKKGYQQFKKYSWKRMARQTHAVYLEVLGKD